MFDSWQRGTQMVLKRNPYYWQMGEDGKPLPYLDEVDFPIIPDDATRILKLQAGEVDGAELIPYARVQELKNDPNLNMALFPSTKVTFLTMNVRPKLTDGSANPLADRTGAPGAELRRRQDRADQDRHLRRRHAGDLLHVLGHAAGLRRRAGLSL